MITRAASYSLKPGETFRGQAGFLEYSIKYRKQKALNNLSDNQLVIVLNSFPMWILSKIAFIDRQEKIIAKQKKREFD